MKRVCRIFIFILSALILSFSSSSYAATPNTSYVSAADLPPQLLPPPPAEKSAAFDDDLHIVLMEQEQAGPADTKAMRDEQHLRLELITQVLGPDFTRAQKPKTFLLLDRVLNDAQAVTEADKTYWHTRRPYLADTRVHLLVDPLDNSPAYPSGHTSETRVLAEVLGLLYPGRIEDLRARAETIAWHRVEAGVHYPADLEGGRMLAMLMMGALMKSEAFQADLATARTEITTR
jgi:acid phosphatase (class A)